MTCVGCSNVVVARIFTNIAWKSKSTIFLQGLLETIVLVRVFIINNSRGLFC